MDRIYHSSPLTPVAIARLFLGSVVLLQATITGARLALETNYAFYLETPELVFLVAQVALLFVVGAMLMQGVWTRAVAFIGAACILTEAVMLTVSPLVFFVSWALAFALVCLGLNRNA